LLADNNADFLETWGKVLSEAGHNIRSASTPDQTRKILRETSIDIAILDLRLVNDEGEKDITISK
jgi:DNA-binding response OmpR family regulator